ncbi:hypothetical protein [Aulosira sp. FACHB-615]|uniref:hypothetical protein n=1 Tax=Aulosira sp. FACHB-615 TaxID=2692777 RepID=UPI0016826382|nr:hypothetical protein [Aulosira sp. FACHB-615]MBD2492533.1 hypothetical protein [Aulosira sp. FACHB-615]
MDEHELRQEIIRRINLVKAISSNTRKQAIALEYCSRDIITFLSDWVWTYDPRIKPSTIPFKPFPKQIEYLLWRIERRSLNENGITAKSRDMGITWLNVVSQVHCWLFEDGYKGSFGSRKQDLVDRIGDMDSIMEKARFLLRNLPKWMLPKDFDWGKHDNFMKLINPSNGSTITAEAGDSIGRGGRSSVYDLDEAGFIVRPSKVEAALSNNTNVIFYTSSANGIGNPFYKKWMTYPDQCKFYFHWKSDPRKSDRWYQEMKARFDPVIVASEIDIDFGASVEGIFIPASWVQAAIALDIPEFGTTVAGLDIATTGKNQSVFTVRHGPVIKPQISWSNTNTTVTAHKTRDLMIEFKIPHLNFDTDGLGEGVDATLSLIDGLEFTFTAVHGASRPSEMVWEGEQRTSAEKFANKRAELWGIMRDRFRKTYDHVNGITVHPTEELISIPNDTRLIAQLSQPLGKRSSTGKILIESKEDMRRRGVDSPDFADSLSLTMEQPSDDWFDIGEQRGIYGAIAGY